MSPLSHYRLAGRIHVCNSAPVNFNGRCVSVSSFVEYKGLVFNEGHSSIKSLMRHKIISFGPRLSPQSET